MYAMALSDRAASSAPVMPTRKLTGYMLDFRADPLRMFMVAREGYGDLVRVRMGPVYVFFAHHPDHLEHMLVRNVSNWTKQTRGYNKLRMILGDGLVTSEGDLWRRQRRIANPAFHRRCLAGFAEVMASAAERQADAWRDREGEVVDVAHEMSALTLHVVGETLFGSAFGAETQQVGDDLAVALHHHQWLTSAPMPYPELLPIPGNFRFRRAVRSLQDVVGELISARRASGEQRADLLGMLMDARDAETGEPMPESLLKDEAVTMLLAGHETTANALAWTLYLLSVHPEHRRRVEAELDSVLGGRTPSAMDAMNLPQTERVLMESMRLFPPVWAMARCAAEDDSLSGYHIPAGSFVYTSVHALHRHPDHWQDPDGFDPDRFLPERSQGRHRYAYLPFSGGQRKCIGDRFAKMEALIMLATLLQRFKLDVVSSWPVVPDPSLTLRPLDGLKMTVRTRNAA